MKNTVKVGNIYLNEKGHPRKITAIENEKYKDYYIQIDDYSWYGIDGVRATAYNVKDHDNIDFTVPYKLVRIKNETK